MAENSAYNLLRKRYPEKEYALLEEVSDAAGFSRSRSADFVVMSLWPSRGLSIHGIELKSHRNDWLNEKKNPKKSENIQQYCNYFWLLTNGDHVAKAEEIPETWGWLNIKGSRIVTMKEAPKLSPTALSSNFVACMLKRAANKEGYTRTAEIEDRIREAELRGKQSASTVRNQVEKNYELLQNAISDLESTAGVDLDDLRMQWRDSGKRMGRAFKFLYEEGGVEKLQKDLLQLESSAQRILSGISAGLEAIRELQQPVEPQSKQ